MKAMILAAGRGERLRPLTDTLPKALVEAGGKSLLAWQLERLAAGGCREAVVNVSYLGDQIVERMGDGARFGVHIEYSRETEPLETAGGIAKALQLLGTKPFLLVNADVYCEYDYARLLPRSLDGDLAHLVLVANPAHRATGDFSLRGGRVGGDTGPRYTYAGIALMSPQLVAGVQAGQKAALGPLLHAAAAKGQLGGERFDGTWRDVGTVERLAELNSFLALRNETR
jgi:MurNAc alpha-1-phosphate uridylyltransferase